MGTVRLTKVVEVERSRIDALTPEAFALVLEARGWDKAPHDARWSWWDAAGPHLECKPRHRADAIGSLAAAHHSGSTFDAFTEVERVQALLETVEAAERGEWLFGTIHGRMGPAGVALLANGALRFNAPSVGTLRLWPRRGGRLLVREDDPDRAAREARAQLPRLVRIICGVGKDGA